MENKTCDHPAYDVTERQGKVIAIRCMACQEILDPEVLRGVVELGRAGV